MLTLTTAKVSDSVIRVEKGTSALKVIETDWKRVQNFLWHIDPQVNGGTKRPMISRGKYSVALSLAV